MNAEFHFVVCGYTSRQSQQLRRAKRRNEADPLLTNQPFRSIASVNLHAYAGFRLGICGVRYDRSKLWV
jgi:hypothetical protein